MKAKESGQKIELDLIQNNPYRILGAPIFSTEREIQKHITKSNRFAEVGKTISFETDFPFLGKFDRNTDSISKAAKSIEQPLNKILYSSFWFLNENHIDNIAFESLQKGDYEKALGIWEKVVGNGEVSDKKFSNLQNLKTLYLALSVNKKSTNVEEKIDNRDFNKTYFIKGIELSGKYINHKDFKSFCKKIVGDKFNFSIEKIENLFLDSILSDIKQLLTTTNGPQIIKINEIIDSVVTFSSDTQFKFSQKFSAGETNRIEKEIETAQDLRKENPINAYRYGKDLHDKTKDDINSLLNILGDSDVKYQMIADKLANEILQCAIIYFNKQNNQLTNAFSLKAYELCKYAKLISQGDQTKQRVDQNTKIIKKACENGLDASNYSKKILLEIEKIATVLEKNIKVLDGHSSELEKKLSSFDYWLSAKNLVTDTRESRELISESVGDEDKGYITISDTIVIYVMALLIEYVNATAPVSGVEKSTLDFLKSVSSFPMKNETRNRYQTNLSTLTRMYNQSNSGGGGCYIATMVYGSYEHPQVMILREFRDNFLSKYLIGRCFIKFYYKYSPSWVETMKNMKTVNLFIRFLLNKIILIIKK